MTVKRIWIDCILAEMHALEVKQLDLVHWLVTREVLDVVILPPGQWPACAGMAQFIAKKKEKKMCPASAKNLEVEDIKAEEQFMNDPNPLCFRCR